MRSWLCLYAGENSFTCSIVFMMNMNEIPLRSWCKAFTWRVSATLCTVLITYAVVGNLDTAVRIGLPDFVFKLVVFYFHERLWLSALLQRLLPVLDTRRLAKMASWKATALSMTLSITYWVTGSLHSALKVGPTDFCVKMFGFWLHERVWDTVSWGRTVSSRPQKKDR